MTPPALADLRTEPDPADPARVRELLASTGFFRDDEIAIGVELVAERLARGSASGYELLLADDPAAPRLRGYCCFGEIPLTVGSWDLYWIAVAPDLQGRGLGRRLLAETERRIAAAGGRRVFVDTSGRADYAPTRAFYERCGYTVAARLTDFYAVGDDKVVYSRILPVACSSSSLGSSPSSPPSP